MQRKPILYIFLFLLTVFQVFAQSPVGVEWPVPVSEENTVHGQGSQMYYSKTGGKCFAIRPDGQSVALTGGIVAALADGFFTFKRDSLLGVWATDKGELLPAAYEKIEWAGPKFFKVSIYGMMAVMNHQNAVVVPYQPKFMQLETAGPDTLLMKTSVHPDAKASGFTADGTAIDPTLATSLFPKKGAPKPAAPPAKFKIVREKAKQGVSTTDGTVVLPAEYDEIRLGTEGRVAARKDKAWGIALLK